LMLAARITLPHFSVSSAKNLAKSVGAIGIGTEPSSAIRALIAGSARPALISLLRVLYCFHQNNDDSKCEAAHASLPIGPSKVRSRVTSI
jgi:hypothetical protein